VIVVDTNIRLSVSLDLMIDMLLFAIDAVMFCYNLVMMIVNYLCADVAAVTMLGNARCVVAAVEAAQMSDPPINTSLSTPCMNEHRTNQKMHPSCRSGVSSSQSLLAATG
jgi:hypothetical protein